MESGTVQEVLPIKYKLAYSFGSLASGMFTGMVYSFITFFYNTKFGMDERLLGIAWLLFGIWNTINDPIVSYISDNTRHKLGRRTPYIRYGSWVYGLLFILSWFPFAKPGDQIGLFINFIIVMILFDTMFSLIGMCFFCLPAEMTTSAKERASIGLYSAVFNILGLGVQFFITSVYLTGNDTRLDPRFQPSIVAIGIIFSAVLFVMSYFIKENQFAKMQEHEPFWEGLKKTFKNKPFLIYEVASFSNQMLMTIIATGILYYLDYVILIDLEEALTDWRYIVAILAIGAIVLVGMVFLMKNIDRYGPKRISVYGFTIAALGFLGLFFTGRDFFHSIVPLGLLGVGAAAGIIITAPLVGDIMDYDETLTGERREGVYAGVNAVITKPSISIANWAFLFVISWFGFVRPTVEGTTITKHTQTPEAITGILIAFALLPAIFMIVSAIAMVFYPLDGPAWKKKKFEIQQLHNQKEQQWQKENKNLGSKLI
jgi:GPH family glycoside/pentoside/hexuronide:cation symporter